MCPHLDDQVGIEDCAAYQWACSYPDQPVLFVLDGEDGRECVEYVLSTSDMNEVWLTAV